MSQRESDEELRARVWALLFDYAIQHLTRDYVEFTKTACSELCDLQEIPTTDPKSLFIPTDPFDILSNVFHLGEIPPYEEKLTSIQEAVAYIKYTLGLALKGKPKSERVSYDDKYLDAQPQLEPFSPVLTLKSIRATPRLGTSLSQLPSSRRDLVKAHSIKAISIEPFEEPKINPDKTLAVMWSIPPEDYSAIRSLFQATSSLSRPGPGYKNIHLDMSCSPPTPPRRLDSPFVPIFARKDLPGSGREKRTELDSLNLISDFPSNLLPAAPILEDEDANLFKEHMVVVDGWHTINTSSPPRLSSPTSSQEDEQMDQLFENSSPNTELQPTELIEDSKIDPTQIPRSKRRGSGSGIYTPIGAEKKCIPVSMTPSHLGAFLLPSFPTREDESRLLVHPQSPENSLSVVGQAPSSLGSQSMLEDAVQEAEVKGLYGTLALPDPRDLIMNEKPDAHTLMDVPRLPPPNVHPLSEVCLPKSLTDFLAPIKSSAQADRNPLHQFLTKAKGIASLRVALSWVPFTVTSQLPNHIQITGVVDPPCAGPEENLPVQELLGKAGVLSSVLDAEPKDHWTNREVEMRCETGFYDDLLGFGIILTKKERHRLASLRNVDIKLGHTDLKAESGAAAETDFDNRPTKWQRLSKQDAYDDSGVVLLDDSYSSSDVDNAAVSEVPLMAGLDPDDGGELSGNSTRDDLFGLDFKRQRLSKQDAFDDSGIVLDDFYSPLGAENAAVSEAPLIGHDDHGPFGSLAENDLFGLDFEQDKENVPPFQFSGQYLEYDNSHPVVEGGQPDITAKYQLGYGDDFTVPWDQNHSGPSGLEDFEVSQPQNPSFFGNGRDTCSPAEVCVADGAKYPTNDTANTTWSEMSREPHLASHTLGSLAFAQLRAKRVQPAAEAEPVLVPAPILPPEVAQGPHVTPENYFDCNTLRLPGQKTAQPPLHVYMASLETIQKQAFVRALRSPECAVELAERGSLDGMDLILDPHTGVLLISLFLLPSQCAALITRIAAQSWRFARILVIFEAYPAAHPYWAQERSAATPNAYTPPITKALRKVRRDLDIAEACGEKRAGVGVQYAFSNDVREAAVFVRHYGELAEGADAASVLWGAREWLDVEVEDEEALAGVGALNRFSAAVVLTQVGAEELLEMTPEARLDMFGPLIGRDTVETFNAEMVRRFQVLESSDDVGMSGIGDT